MGSVVFDDTDKQLVNPDEARPNAPLDAKMSPHRGDAFSIMANAPATKKTESDLKQAPYYR